MPNRRYYFTTVILLLLACLFISSCNSNSQLQNTDKRETVNTVTVTDEIGRKIEIPRQPLRIISLAPNITEILFALGLGDKVVGVTSFCNYPAETTKITKVGDTLHPNLEQIIALKPDLVLMSTASQLENLSAKLSQAQIPLYILKSPSIEATLRSIENLSLITGRVNEGKALVGSLRERLAKVAARGEGKARPKVFFIVGVDPLITAGRAAFITDAINIAGGSSISADVEAEWPAYSIETVIARAPEIILTTGWTHNDSKVEPTLPAGLEVTPAVRNKRIFQLDGDLILRPGPRIVDGLEQLSRLFHPEVN